MLNGIDIAEAVMKLVGPVLPTGGHEADLARLENIKVLTQAIDRLVFEVDKSARYVVSPHGSERAIGQHANSFLACLAESLPAPPQ